MKSATTSVTTAATLLIAASKRNRTVYIHPSASTYIGNSAVTSAIGFHCLANAPIAIELPINETIYGITAAGTSTVSTLTPDAD
jgi:hypothetical protein